MAAAGASVSPQQPGPGAGEHRAREAAPSFRAFLDFKALQADVPGAVRNCENRGVQADPARVAELYDRYVAGTQAVDGLRAERNRTSAEMKARGAGGGSWTGRAGVLLRKLGDPRLGD